MNMNFPLQVITHRSQPFFFVDLNSASAERLFLFAVADSTAAGLDARYEPKHAAVHVSGQPHGQGWPVRQPGRKDEEETAHDAAF